MAKASRQLSMAEKGRKRTLHGGRARRRHGRRWRGAGKLTQGSEGGASASVSRREARRSCGREQSGNGAAARELNAGGAAGAARAELEARLWRGRKGSAGASERVRGHQQVKAGAWARCQAAAAARRATPARSRHAAGFLCRGRGVALRRAREGEREKEPARWAGPGRCGSARRAGGRLAGPASAGGPEARRRPRKIEMEFFSIYFQEIFKCHLSNIILSKKMTSFENVPKMKVA